MTWSIKRTIEPASLPVTRDEAKVQLRETTTDRDAEIDDLIAEATGEVDGPGGWLGRALIEQTLRLRLDTFPSGGDPIRLPLPPVISVTSVQYVDGAGATQTWASTEYDLLGDREPAEIHPGFGKSYPSTRTQPEAVTVSYLAGYGSSDQDVPRAIKAFLKLRIGDLDAHRESLVTGTIAVKLPYIEHMLDNFVMPFDGPAPRRDR